MGTPPDASSVSAAENECSDGPPSMSIHNSEVRLLPYRHPAPVVDDAPTVELTSALQTLATRSRASAEPALGTIFLAVVLYSPIQQPLALARLASRALGRLCREIRESQDQADRWALSN